MQYAERRRMNEWAHGWTNRIHGIQGAATWRIQWHVIPEPHATLQGERIPSTILKIVFRRILFIVFLMQFGLW